ncbi:MAG: LOG family protein, partial [Myxococcota bacterium]
GPIIIFNQDGFFESLFRLLEHSVEERFMNQKHLEMWQAVDQIQDILPAIEASNAWPADAIHFATR